MLAHERRFLFIVVHRPKLVALTNIRDLHAFRATKLGCIMLRIRIAFIRFCIYSVNSVRFHGSIRRISFQLNSRLFVCAVVEFVATNCMPIRIPIDNTISYVPRCILIYDDIIYEFQNWIHVNRHNHPFIINLISITMPFWWIVNLIRLDIIMIEFPHTHK